MGDLQTSIQPDYYNSHVVSFDFLYFYIMLHFNDVHFWVYRCGIIFHCCTLLVANVQRNWPTVCVCRLLSRCRHKSFFASEFCCSVFLRRISLLCGRPSSQSWFVMYCAYILSLSLWTAAAHNTKDIFLLWYAGNTSFACLAAIYAQCHCVNSVKKMCS